ncbi:UDP-2,4-diacetamido-2,4,6-trideoxy-beta-L-altropyranose hydrolase [Pseudomonas sp. F3-2]|uniref:UDP-2,4-diacetamido-2,4, 6-trideoxy-beta-L-altropyranose hydrolase n=1 Tax=Pseudomonas sp. F3-2 TaxID=3141539 RepID=UPI00315E028A
MRVLIRADASMTIGSGHIARCVTLANVLRCDGADVRFACRQLPGHLLQRLAEQSFITYPLPERYERESQGATIESFLPWQEDIDALAAQVGDVAKFDWLIVDHYGLDARWENAARPFARRLMAIDDLANRPHAVDVLLDQNYTAQALDTPYARWIDARCQTFLGPRFALMRDEFQCEPIPIRPKVERVLVNFGGFDAAGQVYATMLALQGFADLQVDFVAGLHNPHWQTMSARVDAHPGWRLYTQVSDFFSLMQQADLFIGAGGGTTWERAALGLPTLCISVANNQQLNAQLLADAGVHLYLGPHQDLAPQRLTSAVANLRDDPALRQAYADRSRALVDGRGARRIADALAAAADN